MNNFNKSLLAVFMISLFSLVSIQSINRIVNGPQVLGDTTSPTPTSSSCNTNLTNYTLAEPCTNNYHRYVKFVCNDGYQGMLGGPTSCKDKATWISYARQICIRRCQQTTPPTTTPQPISANGVPCEAINNLQKTYCSNIPTPPVYPSSTPGVTRTPPTPTSVGTSGFQQSILINNAENYASVNASNSLTLYGNNGFTAEAFIKIADDPQMKDSNPHYIIARQHNEGQGPGYALSLVNKKIEFEIYDLGSSKVYNVAGTTSLEPNRWYHVKGVLRYKDLFVFIDNKLDGSATAIIPTGAGPFIPTNKLLTIGCMKGSNPSFTYCLGNFIGQIEEIRLSKTSRLPDSLGQPTAPFTNDSSTIGLWHLDSNYLDSSSNNNNGYPSSKPPQFAESYLYPVTLTPTKTR